MKVISLLGIWLQFSAVFAWVPPGCDFTTLQYRGRGPLAAVTVEEDEKVAPTTAVDTMDKAASVWSQVAVCEPKERSEILKLPGVSRLPEGLSGTYYVNGLASCRVFGKRLVHPFEAHGFCKSFTFDKDRPDEIRITAKYVQTPVRQWEERLQRPLWRGAMSSIADTSTLLGRVQNALAPMTRPTANLAVRAWRNDVFVSSDNGPFYTLDAATMDTKGEAIRDTLGGYQMLAHTRVDQRRNRLVAIALSYEPAGQATLLTCFEFDQASGALVSKRVHRQSPAIVVHDWTLTPHYYVIPAAEAVFDLNKLPDLITGKSTATEIFEIDSQAPGTVLLIPRPDIECRGSELPMVQARLEDDRHGVVFHMGPCHEEYDEDGTPLAVVTHPFVFDKYQFGGEMGFLNAEQRFDPTPWAKSNGGPKLEKWTIPIPSPKMRAELGDNDVAAIPAVVTMKGSRLNNVVSDMPTFDPKCDGGESPSRFVYSLAGIRPMASWFPFNSIARHDLATGDIQIWPPEAASAARGEFNDWDGGDSVRSEPLFVPREGATDSSDGFLLSTTHDTKNQTTFLDIYDAQRVADGPSVSLDLGELWGWNVHSTFVPSQTK